MIFCCEYVSGVIVVAIFRVVASFIDIIVIVIVKVIVIAISVKAIAIFIIIVNFIILRPELITIRIRIIRRRRTICKYIAIFCR